MTPKTRRRRVATGDCRSVPLRSGQALEGEVNAAPCHPEIIFAAVDNVPAKIAQPADVRGEANLEATAELADRFGRGT
jgi:hypothetical protein